MSGEAKAKVEESEVLPPQDAWLRAYLETLVYHTETFNALRRLEAQVYWLTMAIEAMREDSEELLHRTKGGFWKDSIEQLEGFTKYLEGRINEEVTSPKKRRDYL